MHNVHGGQPILFQTRWAMNYLAGPLTRVQIPGLNRLAGASPATRAIQPGPEPEGSFSPPAQPPDPFQAIPLAGLAETQPLDWGPAPSLGSLTRPALPAGVTEYFLPNNLTLTQAFKAAEKAYPSEAFAGGILYRPAILAQAQVRFFERKYGIDQAQYQSALVRSPDRRGVVRWEETLHATIDPQSLDREPIPQAQFAPLEAPFNDNRLVKALLADFQDWVYRTARLILRAHDVLGIYVGPDVSQAEFRRMCADAARQRRDAEVAKASETFAKQARALELRLEREQRELDTDETELGQRRIEEMGTHAETVLSLFSKNRRRISTSLTKRRLTEQARSEVEESRKAIRSLEEQIEALAAEQAQAIAAIHERWGNLASQDAEISLSPLKRNVLIDLFGVAWVPYHLVQVDGGWIELPGYSADAPV
jgi:hypothetical protein